MKYTYKNAALSALLLGASLAMPSFAIAFDLNGARASDADNCTKVFVRKGSQVTFTDMSDVYGGVHHEGEDHRKIRALPHQDAERMTARRSIWSRPALPISCCRVCSSALREVDASSVIPKMKADVAPGRGGEPQPPR